MPASKSITVELGPQQASLRRHLKSGNYTDADEVLREALRALDWREAALDELLHAKVKASMANRNPNIPAEEVFRRLEQRHGRKVKAAKRDA